MKRLTALVLTVMLAVFSLAGCSADQETANKPSIAVFYYTYDDNYIASVRQALDSIFESVKLNRQNYNAESDQELQNGQIKEAIDAGAKILLVNIVSTGSDEAAQAIVNMAKSADIPLVFFNREISDKIVNSYERCAYVGTRPEEAGHMQGKMIGEYLLENYEAVDLNQDGQISYAMMMGEEDNAEAKLRTQYSVEDCNAVLTAAEKPELIYFNSTSFKKYQADMQSNWSAKAATEYMNENLRSFNPENNNMIELIICNNDSMAEGVIYSLNARGYNRGASSQAIPVFGVDATESGKALIAENKMAGTIKQDCDAMASCLALLASNGAQDKELLSGTDNYIIDTTAAKIRIPYQMYMSE